MQRYDIILAGGGAAGLSLACHLVHSPLCEHSILIVDQDTKEQDDHVWCFWADQPTLFDEIISRSWDRLRVAGEGFTKTLDLGSYRYNMIRGNEFYRFARRILSAHPNVEFVQGHVERIDDGTEDARVWVDGKAFDGTWVFDSLFRWSDLRQSVARDHTLQQQFKGWEVETPAAAFDPPVATFLDFRTPQRHGLRFMYLLPLSDHQALLEYVLCAADSTSRETCEGALRVYLAGVLGLATYRIVREEQGISPLTDRPFPRRTGRHVMAIGVIGGMIKPSTGYAFMRIQQDSAAIVRSLVERGHPYHVPRGPRRYRYFDAVMLDILERHGEWAAPILLALFRHNSAPRVLRFLDEAATPGENLVMVPSLPPRLLLQSARNIGVLCRI